VTRVLAVADEVAGALYGPRLAHLRPDLVLSCGDLPFDYLEYIVTLAGAPLLYVPGNHDPDVSGRAANASDRISPFLPRALAPVLGPCGCTNIDGRIVEAAGLRIAGLGGSIRYSRGPNQYTQPEMRRRARALQLRRLLARGRGVDVIVSHAPPLGVGDGSDPAHTGIAALGGLIEKWSPKLLVHGHVHNYGRRRSSDRRVGATTVVNAVGYRYLEVET
jgi:hypothetical protein